MHWVRLRWLIETSKKLSEHIDDVLDRRDFIDGIQELVAAYATSPSDVDVSQLRQLNVLTKRVLFANDKDMIDKCREVIELITNYLNRQDSNEAHV